MSKYNVGDVVKLRDDLTEENCENYSSFMDVMKGKPIVLQDKREDYMVFVDNDIVRNDYYYVTDEMIEGLWEECKEKQDKLKLIDVLNMIAKGELKEGTKVKWQKIEYIFEDGELEREGDEETVNIFEDMYCINLNDEKVELIEPPCEHEWLDWETHRMGEGRIRRYRRCNKCGLEEETEDNHFADVGKMVEELKYDEIWEWDPYGDGYEQEEFVGTETAIKMIFNKLNEVIRKINKEK